MKISLSIKLFLFFIISSTFLFSQNDDRKSSSLFDKKEAMLPVQQQPGLAFEDVINPKEYYIGPSDVFAVNIWISPPLSFSLTVTPEGSLIIPTVGEVQVADTTLEEAKNKIIRAVRRKYIQGDVSATLSMPRPIIIVISGSVMNPGTYTARSIDRVDKIIQQANVIKDYQYEYQLKNLEEEQSTRNIVLKRKNGIQQRVDLPKFYATKNNISNPFLREGDVIIVPRKDRAKNVVAIYGEVNTPGRYEFVEGDSIHDIIEIAHGFTPRAIVDSIEFTRLDVEAKSMQTKILNGMDILAKMNDVALQPGDRIIVKPKVELREDYVVEIKGEVLYPGKYPITKDRTMLSDVIKQAGGFTEFASLKTSEVIRRSVLPDEIETERLMSSRGSVSAEDSAYYILETNLRIRKEIVAVDFEKVFIEKDNSRDIILRTDDQIVIPNIRTTIYVFGQVKTPGNAPFIKGKDVNYYIQKAGGLLEDARESDIKIIKAQSKQWLAPKETILEEGDYIWIPKIPERTFAYYATIASQLASVLSVIVGVLVVVSNIKK